MLGRIASAIAVVGAVAWLRKPRAVQAPEVVTQSLTIRASLAEIEFFLLDEPSDFPVTLVPAPGAGTEVHVRLTHYEGSRDDADRRVRTWLRRMKQLIETGEVARVDTRVRGGELRV